MNGSPGIIFLRDRFVTETEATVSVMDRSFLYGDGLFETVRIARSQAVAWNSHFDRLCTSARQIGIPLPYGPKETLSFLSELLARNRAMEGVVRVTLSRGIGRRGYTPPLHPTPLLVMVFHPMDPLPSQPLCWRLITSSCRLSADPLSAVKSTSRLLQVQSRLEAAKAGADEALLRGEAGGLVEGASSNLFFVRQGTLSTPPLGSGCLPGTTRARILHLALEAALPIQEITPNLDDLTHAEAVFLTNSTHGIIQAISLDGHALANSPLTSRLYQRYLQSLR